MFKELPVNSKTSKSMAKQVSQDQGLLENSHLCSVLLGIGGVVQDRVALGL